MSALTDGGRDIVDLDGDHDYPTAESDTDGDSDVDLDVWAMDGSGQLVELMMNAAIINLVAFSFQVGNLTGQTFGLFVIALAAAEVAVGIGIILVLYRNFGDIDVMDANTMRW